MTPPDAKQVTFTIPAATPNGDYLVRFEHIGLHVANSVGAAQFYLSCGQITITGGGGGTPGPLVAFPGAYSATDPGILISIYYPVVSNIQRLRSGCILTLVIADELHFPWAIGMDRVRMGY